MDLSDEQLDRILALPVPGHDMTVREYFSLLLVQAFQESKYGWTGNSDWQYDLYAASAAGGVIEAFDDELGMSDDEERRANVLLLTAIRRLGESE